MHLKKMGGADMREAHVSATHFILLVERRAAGSGSLVCPTINFA
jgi:hypothetical protein